MDERFPVEKPERPKATRRRSRSASPTLGDVAREAGVSTATVSRALSAPDTVGIEARQAVAAVVERLAYVRHGPARALASKRTYLIGAVVPTLDNPIFARCLETLQSRLQEVGFSLILATSGYSPDRELASIRILLERGIDGLMLVGGKRSAAVYALLAAKGVQCCVTWSLRDAGKQVCVGFDNAKAAAGVVEHLYQLGHRRFGMVAGLTGDNDRAADRVAGVREALRAHGLKPTILERAYTVTDGREALKALARLGRPPTAIVCGNDILALGVLAECARLGLRVPQDVSVTGFDDLDLATCTSPMLTTVRVAADEIGYHAANRLIALTTGEGSRDDLELPTALIVRGSTAAVVAGDRGA